MSCAVHGAALTAALGYSAYAGATVAAAPPLVQVQASEPSAPSAPPETLPPDVVVEAVVFADRADHREVAEPVFEAMPPVGELEPIETIQPSLQRIAAPPTAAAPAPQAASAPAAAPQPWVEAVECADNEPPRYPESERLAGREGKVVVTVTIDARGEVLDVALRQPSRHAAFNREALRAVRAWRFIPARLHGAPAPTTRSIEVDFRLVVDR